MLSSLGLAAEADQDLHGPELAAFASGTCSALWAEDAASASAGSAEIQEGNSIRAAIPAPTLFLGTRRRGFGFREINAPAGLSANPETRTPMKIAQIAPLAESCPPRLYGGTERIVSYLTEELVRRGHDVTLFASGDSCTAARTRAILRSRVAA